MAPINAAIGLIAMYFWNWKIIDEFEMDPNKKVYLYLFTYKG